MQKIRHSIYNLLRWSEKYTKTDMVYLTKGMSWLTFGQVISAGSSFVLAIAFANLIPQETLGIFKYILSVAGILGIATLLGMGKAVTRAVAQGNEGTIISATKTRIKWSTMGSIVAILIAGYYFLNDNTALTFSFLIVAVFLPFYDTFSIYHSLLQGRKIFSFSAKYDMLSHIIAATAIITTLSLTDSLLIILFAYFSVWSISRLCFFALTLRKFPPNNSVDLSTISYGKHLSAMSIIGAVAGNLDKILLWHFFGAAQVAIYFFSIAPVIQIRNAVQNISPLVLPNFAKRSIQDIKQGLTSKMLKLFLVIVPIITAYIIAAPYIFQIFFPQYMESVVYSQVFALILLLQPGMFMGSIMEAHAKTKQMYITRTVNPVIRILLFIVLAPLYGIMGVIIAKLIAEFLNFILKVYLTKTIT